MKKLGLILMCGLAFSSAGCANLSKGGFAELGSSVLNAAGVPVSSESLNTAFDASEKISKASRGLTDEQEYYLGRGVSAVVLSKYKTLRNESVVRYVNKVARSVAIYSDRPETFGGYYVAVLDSNEVNAVAAPGGFIFITKGFLKLIPNEEALAAVMGGGQLTRFLLLRQPLTSRPQARSRCTPTPSTRPLGCLPRRAPGSPATRSSSSRTRQASPRSLVI
jgi:hypothetical protein